VSTSIDQPSTPINSSIRSHQIAQACVLIFLYAVPALVCIHSANVSDPDIWWHLRTGQWIQQHHAVPHTDFYSSTTAGKPWAAYSWLFELLTFQLFSHLGLTGIVTYTAGMLLLITAAIHHLVRRLQFDFTLGVLLTYAACFSFGHLYTPRPWLFTLLFFALELDILMHARRTGRLRELAWLPLLFALWANLHIQFIDGLVVLAIALAESLLFLRQAKAQTKTPSLLRPLPLAAALFACLLATLINPYGWHIYQVAFQLASQSGVLNIVTELQAMPFRDLSDYVLLLLTLACAAALAHSRRFLPFETVLFAFAVIVSFRSQRDVWVMAIAAAAILSSTLHGSRKAPQHLPSGVTPLLILLASFAATLGFPAMHRNNATLNTQLAANLPVQAVEAAKARGYTGTLFNDYNWGGYLIWSLHLPVSIDGRAALYGDQAIDLSRNTWNAQPDWATDPQLLAAGLIITPLKSPLTQLLRIDPRFELTYQDKTAALFLPRKPPLQEP
jgi:hypothetical protein